MDNLAQLFGLLSDPVRLKLLGLLAGGERCVCQLHEPLGLQQSTASRHLMLLRTAGVVTSRRVGTWMHYRIAPELWKAEWKTILPQAIETAAKQLQMVTPKIICSAPKAMKPSKESKSILPAS